MDTQNVFSSNPLRKLQYQNNWIYVELDSIKSKPCKREKIAMLQIFFKKNSNSGQTLIKIISVSYTIPVLIKKLYFALIKHIDQFTWK